MSRLLRFKTFSLFDLESRFKARGEAVQSAEPDRNNIVCEIDPKSFLRDFCWRFLAGDMKFIIVSFISEIDRGR